MPPDGKLNPDPRYTARLKGNPCTETAQKIAPILTFPRCRKWHQGKGPEPAPKLAALAVRDPASLG